MRAANHLRPTLSTRIEPVVAVWCAKEDSAAMSEQFDVIVIGAGQAGLAVSHELGRAGLDHIVLEKGRVSQTWRERWNSFCVVIRIGASSSPATATTGVLVALPALERPALGVPAHAGQLRRKLPVLELFDR